MTLKIPPRQRAPAESEEDIHRRIVRLLGYMLRPSVIMFHTPNGGHRRVITAHKLKGAGVVPGVPDLLFLAEGRAYGMEIKRPKGRQSDDQIAFEERCRIAGVPYTIVTSHEEAIACAQGWGLCRPAIPNG